MGKFFIKQQRVDFRKTVKTGWEGGGITEEVISPVEFVTFSSYRFPLLSSGAEACPRELRGRERGARERAAVVRSAHAPGSAGAAPCCERASAFPGAAVPGGVGLVTRRKQSQHFF